MDYVVEGRLSSRWWERWYATNPQLAERLRVAVLFVERFAHDAELSADELLAIVNEAIAEARASLESVAMFEIDSVSVEAGSTIIVLHMGQIISPQVANTFVGATEAQPPPMTPQPPGADLLTTTAIMAALGIRLPRVAVDQFNATVPISDPQPGDLVFFANTYQPGISHVGMYIGNGLQINAPTTGQVVSVASMVSGYWGAHYAGARRVRS
jgi:hypothetical protein